MTNRYSQVLDLYATGSWRSLKALRNKINNNGYKELSPTQLLLLTSICESPLDANYSPELIERLRQENPIAALGLLISRASIAHAIAKLIKHDTYSAKEYIDSSLAALLTTIDLVGIQISDKKKKRILNGTANLSNCMHSQIGLKQTLLQEKFPHHLTFVLGMHRSGTSALTGMLAHAGFSAPKDLMPATTRNPKGYWESTRIMEANNALLNSLSSHWTTAVKLPAYWIYTEQARTWRESLLNFFREDFASSHHPIIKDPRFCLLIEGLQPWLESDLINPSFIIAIRDPSEVVQSLKKAENIGISRGLSLWIAYNLKAIEETHLFERRIIDYHQLLESPSVALTSCSEMLTTNSSNCTFTTDPISFIDPLLCNQNPLTLDNQRIEPGEENADELIELAQTIYKIIIHAQGNPELLEDSLKRLEYKFLAARI